MLISGVVYNFNGLRGKVFKCTGEKEWDLIPSELHSAMHSFNSPEQSCFYCALMFNPPDAIIENNDRLWKQWALELVSVIIFQQVSRYECLILRFRGLNNRETAKYRLLLLKTKTGSDNGTLDFNELFIHLISNGNSCSGAIINK